MWEALNPLVHKLFKGTLTHLASIFPVDDLDSFLSCEAVDVNLIGVPTAVPLLLGPAILEVELHLHLIYPLYMEFKK